MVKGDILAYDQGLYFHHLYASSLGKIELNATSDIYSKQGRLLFKLGDIITPDNYPPIRHIQLINPLAECVTLLKPITSEDIYQQINTLISNDACFRTIDEKFSHAAVLLRCCNEIKQYPRLDEALTLFSILMPSLFEASLKTAYFSYLFSIVSKYSQDKMNAAFLAALAHDIGLLFISRKITLSTGNLTGEEWAQIQLHPNISYKLLCTLEDFPQAAKMAVLHHHECADGSGYCFGKTEEEISELASLIGILDDIVAIYSKKFKPLNRSLHDLLPILQMNTHSYPRDISFPILSILKAIPPSEVKPISIGTLRDLIEYTYQQQLYINRICDVMEKVGNNFTDVKENEQVIELLNNWKKVMHTVSSSGVQESSYLDWLVRLETESREEIYSEVEYMRLMLEETIYQINNFYNNLNNQLAKGLKKITSEFNIFSHIYAMTEKPSIPSSLLDYWDSYNKD